MFAFGVFRFSSSNYSLVQSWTNIKAHYNIWHTKKCKWFEIKKKTHTQNSKIQENRLCVYSLHYFDLILIGVFFHCVTLLSNNIKECLVLFFSHIEYGFNLQIWCVYRSLVQFGFLKWEKLRKINWIKWNDFSIKTGKISSVMICQLA